MARNHQQHVGEYIKSEVEVVRTRITLECTECKNRNYNMTKDSSGTHGNQEVLQILQITHTAQRDKIIVVERKWNYG